MTTCWFCGEEMIWGGDFSHEDYGLETDGIVSNLSCPNCDAYAEFYSAGEKIALEQEEDQGLPLAS